MYPRTIPLFSLSMLFLFLLASCQPEKETRQPNIVFIMSDDHAAHAISAYGGIYKDVAPTPNIDRLAAEGVLFTNTFCTNSICGPSRAAIITGKYSHQNGFYKNEGGVKFEGSQPTFPKMLREAGYTTAVIGKWHLGSEPTGFDYFKYHILQGGQGTYWNPTYNENGQKVPESGYATNLTGDFALEWLENKRDKNKPFCLFYQFKAPHRPWCPDSLYMDLFEGKDLPYPSTFNDDYQGREETAGRTMMTIENHLNRKDLKMVPPEGLDSEEFYAWERYGDKGEYLSPSDTLEGQALKNWKYQRYIKDYLACIRSVDDNVGRLLRYLDEQGLAENTIVVYTADQGFYLGDHGWYDKRFMYEESLRMPLLIRYPSKIQAGIRKDELILNIDFAPTLLNWAGVEADPEIQGSSFTGLLDAGAQPEANWRDAIYYHYYEYPKWHQVQPHYGIRTDRYKLIHFYYDVDIWELYDLESDPNEFTNLYGQDGYGELTDELKMRLKELQATYGDDISLEEMRVVTETGLTTY